VAECAGRDGCPHLRESEAAQDRGLMLPLYAGLTAAQQERVAAALRAALGAA
jgi:dTDP-4-amino-4,6-dideoxygalactose transaminase